MALNIFWTPQAEKGLNKVLEFLEEEWTAKEIMTLEKEILELTNGLANAIDSKHTLVIQEGNGENSVYGRRENGEGPEGDGTYTAFLDFNPYENEQQDDVEATPDETLVHELDHFKNINSETRTWQFYNGRKIYDSNTGRSYSDSFPWGEFSAVRAQNEHRATFRRRPRKIYNGVNIYNKDPSPEGGGKMFLLLTLLILALT